MAIPPRHGLSDLGVPALLTAARSADDEAFATLYAVHRDSVLRVARRWSDGDAQVEDLCQDAFVRLLESDVAPSDHSSLQAWLVTVTRNLAVSAHRRRTAQSRAGERAEVAVPIPPPVEVERRLMVVQVISALRPPEVELIVEHYLEQRTLAEMADRRGTTREVVKVQLHRARQRARRGLRDVDLPGLGWLGAVSGKALTTAKSLAGALTAKAVLAALVPALVVGGLLGPLDRAQDPGLLPSAIPQVAGMAGPDKAVRSTDAGGSQPAATSESDGGPAPAMPDAVLPPRSGTPPDGRSRPPLPELAVPLTDVEASNREVQPPRQDRLVVGDEAILAVVVGEDEPVPVETVVQLGCRLEGAVPLVECERP